MPSVAIFGFKNVLAMMFNLDVKNCQRFEDVKNNKGSVVEKVEEKVEETVVEEKAPEVEMGGMFGDDSSSEDDDSDSD